MLPFSRWGKPPKFSLELFILFDDKNLTLAIKCQPDAISLRLAEEPWKCSNPLTQGHESKYFIIDVFSSFILVYCFITYKIKSFHFMLNGFCFHIQISFQKLPDSRLLNFKFIKCSTHIFFNPTLNIPKGCRWLIDVCMSGAFYYYYYNYYDQTNDVRFCFGHVGVGGSVILTSLHACAREQPIKQIVGSGCV